MCGEVEDELVVQIGAHQVRPSCVRCQWISVSVCSRAKRRRRCGVRVLTSLAQRHLVAGAVHLGRGAVVVGHGVEAHVLRIRDPRLELGHDMVDALLEVGPGCG